ncbi:hypothetical protein FOA52_002024 [Chlamydomonas sp. UWO 241]|nr:hypothetical protein FOA52_002024 [Chlamydomonas sp. UWO 241]
MQQMLVSLPEEEQQQLQLPAESAADGGRAAAHVAIKYGRSAHVCAADGATAAAHAAFKCGRGAHVCAADGGGVAVPAAINCGRVARA